MRLPIYFFCLFTVFIFGCQSTTDSWQADIPYTSYSVPCGQDTIIQTEDGVLIEISANTFNCEEESDIEFRFTSVLTKADMIRYQRYTQSSDGRLLESAGMFHFELLGSSKMNPNNPVKVRLPATYAKADMQLFDLNAANNRWELSEEGLETPLQADIERGEQLFIDNACGSCHDISLRNDLTGPALGNVNRYRDRQWLRDYTRNSEEMIANGDEVSNILWDSWGTVMSPYEHLTDEDIDAIYAWIANESARLQIAEDEVVYPMEIRFDTLHYGVGADGVIRDSDIQGIDNWIVYSDGAARQVKRANIPPGDYASTLRISDRNNTGDAFFRDAIYTYPYEIFVQSGNWYNVDRFLNYSTTISPLTLSLENTQGAMTFAVLSMRDFNTIIGLYPDEEGVYRLKLTEDIERRLNFPVDEWVDIIAYSIDGATGELYSFGHLEHLITEENNDLRLELKPTEKSLKEKLEELGL